MLSEDATGRLLSANDINDVKMLQGEVRAYDAVRRAFTPSNTAR